MVADNPFDIPILFLTFDRPKKSAEVFESIRKIQPSRLYFSCDGPPLDATPSQLVRIKSVKALAQQVDWNCELKTLFHNTNLGCRAAVSTALNWFFHHEEKGIILEDDCLPSDTFYPYCSQLLSLYASHPKVGMISGNNIMNSHTSTSFCPETSIICSHGNIWGWATWRDRWQLFKDEKAYWADPHRISRIRSYLNNDKLFYTYNELRKKYISGAIDSWAVPWLFSRLEAKLLTLNPAVNLVRNIGFDDTATHTGHSSEQQFCAQSVDLQFPLSLPASIEVDSEYIAAASALSFHSNLKYHFLSRILPFLVFR